MRWINRLVTAMIVLIVVAGPPLAATVVLVHLRPGRPTPHQFQAWLREPLTAASIVVGIVAVTAASWLMLVSYLGRETIRVLRLRRRRRRRQQHLRLPGAAQLTASSMAGVAALTLPGLHSGEPNPPGPPTGTAPAHPPAPIPVHHPSARASTGIDLPGGNWLPASTALAVCATASLIWLRRRQHYQPAASSPARHGRDADLRPFPTTVDAITTALSDEHAGRPGQSTPALTIDQLPAGVVTLDGPGAASAARGIIVSTALAAATGQPTRSLHLHAADLATLLPGIDAALLRPVGVRHVPADAAAPAQGHLAIRIEANAAATAHWHVDADGITTGTGLIGPQRLCILEPHAATDLITLLQDALDEHADTARTVPDVDPRPATPASPSPSPSAGSLRLIGGCELTVAGQFVHVRRTAGWQILAYLAIHPSGASKTDLIRACWPHQPSAAATPRLHTTISDLRNQLRPLLDADPILRHSDHYQLNPHTIATDLQTWRQTAHLAATAATADARLGATRELITLYRGELAAGQPWPWLQPDREALRRDALDAYTTAAAFAETPERSALLKRALTIDPDNRYLRQHLTQHH
jgi:hypothetical protein